jgi:hypothetical protein
MEMAERTMTADDETSVVAATRRWIERAVIGLNLCPFARTPFETEGIRYAVSAARNVDALVADLDVELRRLHHADSADCETTLLIHPHVLQDFLDYNDFLDVADAVLDALDLGDAIQIASFHPSYQFADTSPDDVENCTNRSPFPMLHLLRQASVDRAVAAFPDTAAIYQSNIATLRRLGAEGWRKLGLHSAEKGNAR